MTDNLGSVSVSADQLRLLTHAIGWPDKARERKRLKTVGDCYRNRYVAGPGHDSWPNLTSLCDIGLMRHVGSLGEMTGCDDLFVVTNRGFDVVRLFAGGGS